MYGANMSETMLHFGEQLSSNGHESKGEEMNVQQSMLHNFFSSLIGTLYQDCHHYLQISLIGYQH